MEVRSGNITANKAPKASAHIQSLSPQAHSIRPSFPRRLHSGEMTTSDRWSNDPRPCRTSTRSARPSATMIPVGRPRLVPCIGIGERRIPPRRPAQVRLLTTIPPLPSDFSSYPTIPPLPPGQRECCNMTPARHMQMHAPLRHPPSIISGAEEDARRICHRDPESMRRRNDRINLRPSMISIGGTPSRGATPRTSSLPEEQVEGNQRW
jgi:hypothetical protein